MTPRLSRDRLICRHGFPATCPSPVSRVCLPWRWPGSPWLPIARTRVPVRGAFSGCGIIVPCLVRRNGLHHLARGFLLCQGWGDWVRACPASRPRSGCTPLPGPPAPGGSWMGSFPFRFPMPHQHLPALPFCRPRPSRQPASQGAPLLGAPLPPPGLRPPPLIPSHSCDDLISLHLLSRNQTPPGSPRVSLLPKLDPTQPGASSQVPLRFGCPCPVCGARWDVGGVLPSAPAAPWGETPAHPVLETHLGRVCLSGQLPSGWWGACVSPEASVPGSNFFRANPGLSPLPPLLRPRGSLPIL